MRIKLHERAVPPERDREILDIIGLIEPAFGLSLVQAATDCIKLLSVEGRLLFVNQVGLDELMGGSLDEVRDTVWSAYWPPEARPALEEAIDLTLGGRHMVCEVPRPTEDGVDRLWLVNLSPVYDRTHQLCAILVVSRDLTANDNFAPSPAAE